MNKEDLRHILQQPYQPEDWRKVFDFVFPNVSYLKSPQAIPFSNEKVESFKQLGAVRLNDGKNLAIFEVKVAPNVNIPRNRVELRNLVAPLIDQDRNHGVLVIYEQGSEDYRFTFTAKETVFDSDKVDFVNRETESKRFTYVLGANETCRTPADRLWELSARKEEATIKVIEEAFSVERLSKEFFTKYKQHYQAFVDYMTGSHFKASAFNGDEKRIRDFVKVLLGRIVFLQFVQKKRWLGATDTHYTDGDKNFLQQFWNKSGKNESFYYAHLSPLFFEALNKNERPGQLFDMPDGSRLCVPFLGGGLFEKDRNEPELLTFPPALFEGLFNFFGEYNFTIDENDPFENEVGIDPEMLGHIFENLLEDNKDKGAFYTPKPIVKYMCQESLIQYLLTQLEQNGVFSGESADKKVFEASIGNFVRKYEAHDLIDFDNILAKALHTVKVCDPAIGSGAFPMGILNEMVMLINVLHNASPDVVEDIWQMENWQPATVKRHIIQNSIYGVDIEKGAVDIARLRFWLSLILDEEKPNALPSLDYKIVVGNSLVSKLGDDIIDIDWSLNRAAPDLFGEDMAQRKKELLEALSEKQIAFYQPESDKQKLAEEIRKLKIDLLINQLQLMIEKGDRAKPKIIDYRNKPKSKFTEDYNKYLQCQGWQEQVIKLKRIKSQPGQALEFFDWKLDFPEVLNPYIVNGNGGFDIVIANPPYVSIRTKSFDTSFKEFFKAKYSLATGQYDLYVLFIEKTYELLVAKGVICYIIPKRMLSNENFQQVRLYVLNNIPIFKYVDAEMPFETANVEANIMLGKKSFKANQIESIFFDSNNKVFKHRTYVNSSSIHKMPFNIFPFIFDSGVLNLLFKIQDQNNSSLYEYVEITRGFECGYNDEAIDNKKSKYKLIKADSITTYILKDANFIYCNPDFGNSSKYKTKELFETTPKLMTKFIANKMEFAIDEIGYYNTNSVYNVHLKPNAKVSLEYLLGLLNSKLSTFWFNTAFLNTDTLFPHVQKNQLDSIPIKFSKYFEKEIVTIVANIICQKSNGIDTNELEKQLDILVYCLYEISYNEVKVIDPEFSLSREEYENINLI